MIRILHVFAHTNRGGAETMVMNYYRAINRNHFQFYFINHGNKSGSYDDEIHSLGGEVYQLPRFSGYNIREYRNSWDEFLDSYSFDVIHIHYFTIAWMILPIAKKHGIKTRIVHAHTSILRPFIKRVVFNSFLNKVKRDSTLLMACSYEAGESIFKTNDFKVLYNAVNIQRFKFKTEIRDKIRNSLGLTANCLVIGHTGSFTYPKNHKKILSVFKEVYLTNNDAHLVLVGSGPLMAEIKSIATDLSISQNVHFLGQRSDVNEVLQAFDVFLFPSIFEGLPVALVEAQATGLPCFFSKNITNEVCLINQLCHLISVDASDNNWSNEILHSEKNHDRTKYFNEIENSFFNVEKSITLLEKIYNK